MKKYQAIQLFTGSDRPIMPFFRLINVRMSPVVGILTFMNSKNFMLSSVEHDIFFITSGPVSIYLGCAGKPHSVHF